MDIQALAQKEYILWGANWSLYSAKVRPYLMKKGISYVELNPSHPHFYEKVMPRIGHFTVPVIETPEGDIVADSTEIMEFFESRYPEPRMMPEDKTMAVLAWLIHSYGSEGLHKPAMYFRWNTTRENRLSHPVDLEPGLPAPQQARQSRVEGDASQDRDTAERRHRLQLPHRREAQIRLVDDDAGGQTEVLDHLQGPREVVNSRL